MNFPFFIAERYLVSKKSHNVINIITKIAITGVAIGTMALIVVLSAFNGIEGLVINLFNSFDPDIKITIKEGKTFDPGTEAFGSVKKLDGVVYFTEVIEESALLKYDDKQYLATIKGVSGDFRKMSRLDTMLIDGDFKLEEEGNSFAVIGQGVAVNLGINLSGFLNPINVYVATRTKTGTLNPEEAFKNRVIYPSGVFSIQHDFDSKYIIVPIDFARELLDHPVRVTAIEIGIDSNADIKKIQLRIQDLLGDSYDVKDRFQQHDLLYKIMKSEKWAVFLILTFILMIATFNVIGSLTMLIIDKKKDIKILWNMGADTILIRKIFFIEGLLIAFLGALIGLVAGLGICILQREYGLIKIQGSFVMDAYPVELKLMDFIYVFLTVMLIGAFAAWYPAKQITKKHLPQKE